MDYKQLKEILFQHECKHSDTHLNVYITFTSFGAGNKKDYSWNSRTYLVSSDNKAFQPNKGGYSIFGSCLDGSDQGIRLEQYMKDECGGKDGWVVEDCAIVGYLLIEYSDCNISAPKLFYTRSDALDCMLSRLSELGELDVGKLKKDFAATKEVFEEDRYRAGQGSAWLADPCADWRWKIQPACIYGPTNIAFPDRKDSLCPM